MKFSLIIFSLILMFSLVGAETPSWGEVVPGNCITLTQTYSNSTYTNITEVRYPNQSIETTSILMTKNGPNYNYDFCNTTQTGKYIITTCTDVDGIDTCVPVSFTSGTSNLTLLLFLLGLASLFFIATLVVNEEFFVYISGVLFLISGIYIMIYGIDIVSDFYSRTISYVTIGLGLLFTVGAYIFNSYENKEEEE